MNSYAIDTHIAIERLKEAGFQAKQAEVVTSLFTNLDSQLATKDDLKVAISGLRSELKGDMTGLRSELKEDISGLKVDMTELRSELKEDTSELKDSVTRLEAGNTVLQEQIKSVRTEIKSVHTDLQQQIKSFRYGGGIMLTVMLTQIVLVVTLLLRVFDFF